MNEAARFWKYVDKRASTECWPWKGTTNRGYGTLSSTHGGSPYKAHRISWILHFGKIPAGLVVCHKCDNRGCVNPSHLFLGTQYENMMDAKMKGRMKRPLPKLRGEGNGSAKLKKTDVLKIRELRGSGKSQSEVARLFGVDRTTISCIDTGKTWKE